MKKLHVTIEFDYDVENDVSEGTVEETFTKIAEHWNVYMIEVFVETQPEYEGERLDF